MYHSVIIRVDDTYIDTWDDWKLIPSSPPVIAAPKERTNFVTVPGRDGTLDYSQSVARKAVYDNRTGKLEFYLENGYDGWDWETAYTTIIDTLKGKRIELALEDNPSHYYEGLLWVDTYKSDKGHSKITLEYILHPTMHTRKVEAVVVNRASVKLNKGMAFELMVGVGPSNTFYRKVNVRARPFSVLKMGADGLVYALERGTGTVTAECGGVTAVCTVTVGRFEACSIKMVTDGGCGPTNPVASIVKGEAYQNTIMASAANAQVSVTVMMGGTDVTSTCVTMNTDHTSAEIKMDAVTGDIMITANTVVTTAAPTAAENMPVARPLAAGTGGAYRLKQ